MAPTPEAPPTGSYSSREIAHQGSDAVIDTTIIDLIDVQARDNPTGIAAEWKGASLTNEQLRTASIRVSAQLRERGFGPRDRIPVLTSLGLEMVVAVQGILRLGACYCPMDADAWSQSRIHVALDVLKSDTVVNTTKLELPGYKIVNIGNVLEDSGSPITEEFLGYLQDVRREIKVSDLFYIIFTSGTTGTPKGVKISHGSITHLVRQDYPGAIRIYPGNKILLLFSVAFDGCAGTMFCTLCHGGTLAMASSTDYADIATTCSTLILTPSILATLEPSPRFDTVREIYLGGESPNAQLISAWSSPTRKVYNGYGPSECTTAVSVAEMIPGGPIVLGNLVSGVKIVLLDENLVESDQGEICISGPCLAIGYLNNEEMTNKKFFMWNGARHYRTGDLARRTEEGLFFLGRSDRLVKNRGYLINLETEVEPALLSFPAVHSAASFVQGSQLVGFVTPEIVSPKELREDLKSRYDSFIVPDLILTMNTFPLTPNGKVDTNHLKEILNATKGADDEADGKATSSAPLTNIDVVRKGFSTIFDIAVSKVADNSSFMELGGNSLLAVKLVSFLRTSGLLVKMGQIFTLDTVSEISAAAASKKEETPSSVNLHSEAVPIPGNQLIFFRELELCPAYSCILYTLTTEDTFYTSDIKQLRSAWQKLFSRHSIFRTDFDLDNKTLTVQPYASFNWTELAVSEENFTSICEKEEKSIWAGLYEPRKQVPRPLNNLRVIHVPGKRVKIFWSMHHSVTDGWSLGIILEELKATLDGKTLPEAPRFHEAAQFIAEINARDKKKANEFWSTYFEPYNKLKRMQLELPNPPIDDWIFIKPEFRIPKSDVHALARSNNTSSACPIYAAWALLLSKYSHSNTVGSRIPLTGRSLPWHSRDSVVGPLNTRCPFIVEIDRSTSISSFLRDTHQNVYDLHEFQWSASHAIDDFIPEEHMSIRELLYYNSINVFIDMPVQSSSWDVHNSQPGKEIVAMFVAEEGDSLVSVPHYNGKHFSHDSITAMMKDFFDILQAMVSLPTSSLIGDVFDRVR